MIYLVLLLLTVSAVGRSKNVPEPNTDDPELLANAKAMLTRVNNDLVGWRNKVLKAHWAESSNFTTENKNAHLEISKQYMCHIRELWREINLFPWRNIKDFDTRRQFEKIATPGASALPEDKYREFIQITSQMKSDYSTATICDYKQPSKCDLNFDPEIAHLFSTSHDPEELKHLWIKWRDASGKKLKPAFMRYVKLSDEIAKLNAFSDKSHRWLQPYVADDSLPQFERLWKELEPFYLQLHAYVRRQLRLKYGEKIVSKDGPIPAHLLGNMWSQDWDNIAKITAPFPDKKLPDVTNAMIQQGYTPMKMFRLAESFFVSLNMSAMPELFWKNSIIEKQKDVHMDCHPSAWDFYDGEDFRIKHCTTISMTDLKVIHQQMGHIQYYLQYKHQPMVYKDGANPGFHEAVGDTITLSTSTPGHLKSLGLLDEVFTDFEGKINNLYFVALSKVVLMPFAYVMDKWRWLIFQDSILPENYNHAWWILVERYQGIEPPVDRSDDDFDPGSKYHIIADVDYIRYYVSSVIQFQFYEALCKEAGQYDPANPDKFLSDCNIYGSQKAGQLLKSMLELGSSRPWPDAMEKITGQRKMNSSSLLQYFQPLIDWLKKENEKTNEYIGWKPTKKVCKGNMENSFNIYT